MSGAVTAADGQSPAFPRKRLVQNFTRRFRGNAISTPWAVILTGRGEELLSAVEQVYAELEDGWAKLIGTSHLDRMRRDLMHILSDPGNGQLRSILTPSMVPVRLAP
jgi:hypothetical protein